MRRCIATLLAIFLTGPPEPAFAYTKFGTRVNGRQVTLKWAQTPVRRPSSSRTLVMLSSVAKATATSAARSSLRRQVVGVESGENMCSQG